MPGGVLMNNIKIGEVSSVNEAKKTVRVGFEDLDGKVSRELPVMIPFVSEYRTSDMPKIGENVLCVFLSNSSKEQRGFVIGTWKLN